MRALAMTITASLVVTATAVWAQHVAKKPAYIAGVATPGEETSLNALLADAYSTLRSDAFRTNLRALSFDHRTIFFRVDGDGSTSAPVKNGSVDDLVDVIDEKISFRYVPVPVGLVGGSDYYFALSGITGDGITASFTLGRGNLGNWRSSDSVTRSCAINTVAHEMSHLISSNPAAFSLETQPLKDVNAAKRSGSDAIASYLVGTVAQCTWLQQQGYTPKVDLKSCVAVFGHRGFNGGRCNQFGKSREIKYRPDLYTAHVITD